MSKKLVRPILFIQIIIFLFVLNGCGKKPDTPPFDSFEAQLSPERTLSSSEQSKTVKLSANKEQNGSSAVEAKNRIVSTIDASSFFYDIVKSPKYEMRGVWIATVKNIDMPSGMNKEAFTKWAEETCQDAGDKNLNAIVFHVKPTADALYKSELAPWSRYITGKSQGTDPGYDPLEIMLNAAHKRGLELHAWINPYRVTMQSEKLDELSAGNAAIKNPSWVIGYNNQFYLNPGIPEVRKYLVDCVAELTENYDIDAVHMDDYFYPYPVSGITFPDADAYNKYGTGFGTIEDWRRNNVNTLVADINNAIKKIKPHVQFGISPFGVWRNIATDPTGSNTKAGVENYDSLYADTRQWLKDGSIDYLTPQIYWSRIATAANYTILLDWWNKEALKYTSGEGGGENPHPINLYIGLADYRTGSKDDASWQKSSEISGQITDNREKEAVTGQMHYNFSSVKGNSLGYFDAVKAANYSNIALTPPAPWNGLEQASPAEDVTAKASANGISIKVTPRKDGFFTRKFVIYRFDEGSASELRNDNIIAVIYNNAQTEYLDTSAAKGKNYIYRVTAVSDTGIENVNATISNPVTF